MRHELNEGEGKKEYERPMIVTINLRPEEAVLGACKTSGTSGMNGHCGIFTAGCQNIGS
jgi:hypothetical protein